MEDKKTFWQRNGWEILTIVLVIFMLVSFYNSKEGERAKLIERMEEKDKAKLVSLLEEIKEEKEAEESGNFELFKNSKEEERKTVALFLSLKVYDIRLADKTVENYLENVGGRLLDASKPVFQTFTRKNLWYWVEVPKETKGLETLERDLQVFLKKEEAKSFKKKR